MVNILSKSWINVLRFGAVGLSLVLASCSGWQKPDYPELPVATGDAQHSTRYRIAPGDTVQIFVWRNPEVSTSVPVRPDGILSAPLLEEIPAAGKTPQELPAGRVSVHGDLPGPKSLFRLPRPVRGGYCTVSVG